ncbi:MAG: pyridoxamine 5'-phosphate oxidase [Planctomycetota bacterium]
MDTNSPSMGALSSGRLPEPLPDSPLPILRSWFDEACEAKNQPNPNAMTLATIDPDGRPSARIVLCKHLHDHLGCAVFFTNLQSRKGQAVTANPRVSLILHWDHADRQVRLEGPTTPSPESESDAYFASRRWESRVGAWASDQSRPIASRQALLDKLDGVVDRFGVDTEGAARGEAVEIPRPPHWGGTRVWFERVELWCGSASRVHDRAEWTRVLKPAEVEGVSGYAGGSWSSTRVQP